MPPCKYKFSIANMKFYDEKNGKFIPFLLPDSLNGFFGSSFSEEDKNRLIEEARAEVEKDVRAPDKISSSPRSTSPRATRSRRSQRVLGLERLGLSLTTRASRFG